MSERIQMVEMEAALRADADGSFRASILEKLLLYRQEVKSAMDRGVSPDEFARLEKLHASLTAAEEVVNKLWWRCRQESARHRPI